MYKNGLVAVVVANGKIVREMNEAGTSSVYLPFGCEYSIRFKNQNSERAAVSISIDGKDVLGGSQLVVNANGESEVKAFLEAGSGVAKNAFRFIEKTDKIREHRGDKIDDGLIRIEYQFEEPLPVYTPRPPFIAPRPYWEDHERWAKGLNGSRGPTFMGGAQCNSCVGPAAASESPSILRGFAFNAQQENDAGITVAGSIVNQKFDTTHLRSLIPTKHVIVFQLKGAKSDGQPIVQPVFSRKKVECPTCGKACKSSAKFCSECSTCLV